MTHLGDLRFPQSLPEFQQLFPTDAHVLPETVEKRKLFLTAAVLDLSYDLCGRIFDTVNHRTVRSASGCRAVA
jgi:hypothetical protein